MIRAAFSLGLVILLAGATWSQSPQKPPAFDIADIHSSPPLSNNSIKGPLFGNGRYEIRSANMVDLIGAAYIEGALKTAYGVSADQVVGGPNWLELDRFDIIAAVPAGTKPDTLKFMLRGLLADRFKLAVHNDTRPMPAYILKAGKKPALTPADGSGESGCKLQPASPNAGPLQTYSCRNLTMEQFSEIIRTLPSTIPSGFRVVDETGLKGSWNFDFKYHAGAIPPRMAAMIGERITFLDAIEKQLGLELSLGKSPQPVIVVDSAQKPTSNVPNIEQLLPPLATEFEVAVIKPIAPGARGGGNQIQPSGAVNIQGTLRALIIRAWNIYPNRPEELVSGPAFLDSQRYDIVAKAPTPLPTIDPTSGAPLPPGALMYNDTVNGMLRALLIDRFQIVAHFEDRPIEAFTLTAAKPKLQKADPSSRTSFHLTSTPAGRQWICQNMSMADFAANLQQMAGGYIHNGNVLDATRLEGGWDFTFTFSSAVTPGPAARGEAPADASGASVASTPDSSMTLNEALEKQLGLKLEVTKRPGPVLVIDKIEPNPKGM